MEKEPLSYLKLFEFIKEHGNESLLIFLEDYKHLEEKDLLNLFLFENNDLLKKLLKDKKGVCQICGKKGSTEKHHKKSKGSGGNDTEENLIEVCRICHTKIHTGEIKI